MKMIANNAWILTQNGTRLALISQQDDDTITVTGKLSKRHFPSLDALVEHIGDVEFETMEIEQDAEQGTINGFPIRHNTFFNVVTDPIPSYTKAEKSSMRYAAGYYSIRFPQGWTPGFCPKLSTLSDYDYQGPFTTKLEMQHIISSKNREIKL